MKRVISARSRSAADGSHRGTWPVLDIVRCFPPPFCHARGRRTCARCSSNSYSVSPLANTWAAGALPGLRAQFPALGRLVYLNAGNDGPLPTRAVRAAAEELGRKLEEGRAQA